MRIKQKAVFPPPSEKGNFKTGSAPVKTNQVDVNSARCNLIEKAKGGGGGRVEDLNATLVGSEDLCNFFGAVVYGEARRADASRACQVHLSSEASCMVHKDVF